MTVNWLGLKAEYSQEEVLFMKSLSREEKELVHTMKALLDAREVEE